MRIAIVSDIHGNLTALDAVIADLRETAPDLVLHGGDLAAGGARPAEIVDRIRALGWQGVLGNTDEMLYRPESLAEFARRSPHLESLFAAIEEMAAFTREVLGAERIEWLETLPVIQSVESLVVVHASPESTWVAPGADAADSELESTYAQLGRPITVYAHIHRPYVRRIGDRVVANTGSVSLSYDGDPRASYLLIDYGVPAIRRVAYDLTAETKAIMTSGTPHADWVTRTLDRASFVMP
jgi:putative phosphoesterase